MKARFICEAVCHSDIGGRDEQQDCVEIFVRDDAKLLVLADGMGGHDGGALAAQAVIDVARKQFDAASGNGPVDLLTSIADSAHARINAIGMERAIAPHSTCVLLHLTQAASTWAHVGDSRLYRFKNGRLVGRTIDHSVVELMRLQGRLTEEEMKTHSDQNRLYEALGGNRLPEVETGSADACESDGFLLASDGLWENVADVELEAIFKASDLAEANRCLVELERVRGGPKCDNISLATARRQRTVPSFVDRVGKAVGLRRRRAW